MRPARQATAILVLILLAACSPGTATTTTTSIGTTSLPIPTTTAAPPASTATSLPEGTATVLLAPFSEMGPGWSEQVFPYGETEEFLGTSLGGDGLMLGPEYGTQTPDGSWWFLDAANLRVAHFSTDGTYLDQVPIPEDLLVDGIYFQYQMPQALDDGSIAAGSFREETTMALLRIIDEQASGATFEGAVPWVTTDGTYLYGLSLEDGAPHRLDPGNPMPEPVEWIVARDGSRYLISIEQDGDLFVQQPDAGMTTNLQMRYSEDPEVVARGGIEVETGTDGTIFVLFYGVPESDEALGIGGLFSVSADGEVGATELVVDPFSMSDPGSPAHLGITPGTSTPWMMVVGEDGVHVYTRSG